MYIRRQKRFLGIKKIAFRKEKITMETNLKQNEPSVRSRESDEELINVLIAISVVSKSLAKKLAALPGTHKTEV